ncbi:MAG TPA: hypothetical protein DHW02_01030 [Ktedonobacter sp.]|nr:hypothetical protein [Ktedonobacter sp.]
MTEDKPIYISAEDDITTVRERLSTTPSRYVTLIIPEQSQLRSLTAWRILHKSARELGKEVSVISTDPLVRSVAKEANFSVAQSPTSALSSKTSSKTGKTRSASRPGTVKLNGTESVSEPGNSRGTGNVSRGRTSSLLRQTKSPSSSSGNSAEEHPTNRQQAPQTEQIHPWYNDVPQPISFPQKETEQPATTDALFNHSNSLADTESHYGQMYDLDINGNSSTFGNHAPTSIEGGTSYRVDDEDYRFAEDIRNSAKSRAITPQPPFLDSASANTPSMPNTPLEPADISFSRPPFFASTPTETSGRYGVRDLHSLQDEPLDAEVRDISDVPNPFEHGDPSYRTTPLPPEGKDPYANMEDDTRLPSSLAEQHASATVDSLDTNEHSIHDASQDVIDGEVEYLGDNDEGIRSSFTPMPIISNDTTHSWGEPLPDEEQPDDVGLSRPVRPSNRSRRDSRENQGNQRRSEQLRQKRQPEERRTFGAVSARPEIDDPDFIPPYEDSIAERPTVTMSPQDVQSARNRRPSGKIPTSPMPPIPPMPASGASSRKLQGTTGTSGRTTGSTGVSQNRTPKTPSKALPMEQETSRRSLQPVPMRATPSPARQGQPGTQGTQGQRVVTGSTRRPTSAKATKKLPPPRRSSGLVYIIPIAILVLIIGLVAYLVPTAGVYIALPAKNYSHAVTLKAGTGTGVQPSEQFSNNFVASGVGKATGTVNVGTAPAKGTVTFANTGTIDVTIPSGTVVSTSNGISFTITAEAVVTKAGDTTSNPISDIPVQAQSPGQTGNVAASTITVIPNTSLTAIAQANNTTASNIKLSIVNTAPTTGGGTGKAPAATQQDINTVKATLDKTLDAQYETWLKQHSMSADLTALLSKTEALSNVPSVNTAITGDATFQAKLTRNVTIVVIRAATVQQASASQMNQALKNDKTYASYTVVMDAQHPIQVQKLQTKLDGKVVTFNFIGAGKIVPAISTQQIQQLIAGKRVSDAQTLLLQLPNVGHVTITTGPRLGNWTPGIIPLWTGHIDVHLVPES